MFRSGINLLHATNLLSKVGIFVQIRGTRCRKTNNFERCHHHALIRVLPEEPYRISSLQLADLVQESDFSDRKGTGTADFRSL
jgi:hypothetical protein